MKEFIKKIKGFKFSPSHKLSGAGRSRVIISDGGRFHYLWVKPAKRMLLRMQTGIYKGMVGWYSEIWQNLKPEDGKRYKSYNGSFILRRYNEEHPSILDDHPWRHIDDVRKVQ